MEKKIVSGYEITESITTAGFTYVMGHNPKAPSPYVTWEQDQEGICRFGHYCIDEVSARKDLFTRALNTLPEREAADIIIENLRDEDKAAIIYQSREIDQLDHIANCLTDAFENLDIEEHKIASLMEDPTFRKAAIHIYNNVDHSYENRVLSDNLENLIEEQFQEWLPKKHTAILKISPEEMEILNDVLFMTENDIEKNMALSSRTAQSWNSAQRSEQNQTTVTCTSPSHQKHLRQSKIPLSSYYIQITGPAAKTESVKPYEA